MSLHSSSELEIGDYIAIVRRRWTWFLLPILIAPWAAFFLSSNQPDKFTSTAQVLLGDTAAQAVVDAGSQSTAFRNRQLENELRLASGDAARDLVAQIFNLDEAPEATVTADTDADVLIFSATSNNPDSSANVANAWAETYLDIKQEQTESSIEGAIAQLQSKLEVLQEDREAVRSDLMSFEDLLARSTELTRAEAQLRVDRESSRISGQVTLIDAQIRATAASISDLTLTADLATGGGPRVISMATPGTPINTPISLTIALGLSIGALGGVALGLLRENLDRAVRSPEDLGRLGLVHLGSIPEASNPGKRELALDSLEDPESPQAAAYQRLRSAIEFVGLDQDLDSILVTSAQQGEGKTTTSSNLAVAMAQANKRTILIDGDLRRPRIHKVFRTKQSPGLSSVVLNPATLSEAAWPIPSLAESLVVVPAGALPPHPVSFIGSSAFASATKLMIGLGDFTIIDAPPLLPVADTLSLAKHVSGVVMVVDAGRTSREDVAHALASLTSAGARVIGAVLMGVKQAAKASSYAYASGEDLEQLSVTEAARSMAGGDDVIDLHERFAASTSEADAT